MSEEQIGFFIREEPYGFLSNFERTPFKVQGIAYWTMEHYYQSMKADDAEIRRYIREAPTARIAMVIGQELEHNRHLKKYLRTDWNDEMKRSIMLIGLRAKFKNIVLRRLLLSTGDAILFENNPDDPYWGIGDGSGKSWLGKLLMQVREEIQEGFVY